MCYRLAQGHPCDCEFLCTLIRALDASQEAERQRKKEDALRATEDREKEAFNMAERAKAALVQAEQQRAEEVRCDYQAAL